MSDRKLAFLYSPEIEGLSYPPDCPFKTQRASLTRQRLMSFGLLGADGRIEVAPAWWREKHSSRCSNLLCRTWRLTVQKVKCK